MPKKENKTEFERELQQIKNNIKTKNDIKISVATDKTPYIKKLTNDKVINVIGESGSGKSYFCKRWKDDKSYIIIDIDHIFARTIEASKEEKKIRTKLIEKYGENLPDLTKNIDKYYEDIINFFEDDEKTIVIDCAVLKHISNLDKLKGTVIVLRTSAITCYNRCLKRYDERYPDATDEEKQKYAEHKKKIFSWYKNLNDFIVKLDKYDEI